MFLRIAVQQSLSSKFVNDRQLHEELQSVLIYPTKGRTLNESDVFLLCVFLSFLIVRCVVYLPLNKPLILFCFFGQRYSRSVWQSLTCLSDDDSDGNKNGKITIGFD